MRSAASWSPGAIREALDPRADRYLALFRDEFDGKPLDRGAFEALAARLEGKGLVADVGCGPCGHVAALLTRLGLQTISVDLSPRCIELSRAEQPHLRFEVMDLASLHSSSGTRASMAWWPTTEQAEHLLQLVPGGRAAETEPDRAQLRARRRA